MISLLNKLQTMKLNCALLWFQFLKDEVTCYDHLRRVCTIKATNGKASSAVAVPKARTAVQIIGGADALVSKTGA